MPQRLIAVAAIALAACGSEIAGKRTLDLAPCRLPNLAVSAQCGTIEVPEDRSKPGGRKIAIFAAVLPANTLSPAEDPLVILAGGPGQAASTLAPFAARLAEVRRTRDVVLIDQRGTGRSSPLVCQAFKPRANEVFDTDPLPRAKACVEELQGMGVDLAQYTTTAFIADLEDMREALGYARWNLWGGSYGTRVAQEYLRRHGGRVRAMILDGVAPPGLVIPLDVWRTREEALAAIVKACAASRACAAAHPDVAGTLRSIGETLRDGKEMDVVDPRTGSTMRARVTFDVVLSALQPLTYASETAILLPELIALAAAGDLAPLFAANPQASTRESDQVNAALHFSVTCAEDAPRITPELQRRTLDGLPTRDLALRTIAVCDIWPRGSVPADFGQPVKSDVPALIFSGGMDPVTPPAYGKQVQDDLRVSRHVVAPGYGHIVSFHACGPRLVAAFVAVAGFAKLSDACIRHFETSVVPPLFVNRLGATP
jgi:pimeloyl-ACP methyl ester carboxylesterase